MIIDIHAHLGVDRVFDEVRTEDEILSAMDKNGVDVSIVQPMFGLIDIADIRESHDRIYRFSKQYDKRIFGMISMTPYLKEQQFYDEAKRCVEELGFVGMKLSPNAQAVNPMAKVGEMMWKVCDEFKIPIMVHTGTGIPFSLPAHCIGRAKQFPNVKCIFAHSGMILGAGEVFLAADECSNIYMDTSWTAAHHIEHMVKHYGAKRVMFAGDEASNIPSELAKYNTIDLTEEEWQWCMGRAANEVFRLGLQF
ncbi:MAG: amidohydrolase family protein [Christensenella sp.]|nr:amidohydrolase family protein [Christensenella sp.]MEA5002709.1 amidohydrolase family protein [Christensenella sp.]